MIDTASWIYKSDPYLKVMLNGNWCNISEEEYPEAWAEAQARIAEHGDPPDESDLIPPPTPEQLARTEIAAAEAVLASTRYHVDIAFETGQEVWTDVAQVRADARARIAAAKATLNSLP